MSTPARGDHPAPGTTGPPRRAASDVTVVVVTHRGRDLLPGCLAGLRAQTAPHRLLVIDNASTDGSAGVLAELASGRDDRVVRLPVNAGFAGGVAAALPLVGTRFCALLNDDAVPDPDWLASLLGAADGDDEAAAWTSLMVLADDPQVVNNLGAGLDRHWYGIDLDAGAAVADILAGDGADGGAGGAAAGGPETLDVFGFSGGAALLRMGALRAVGGFPAEFFLYYEDLDTSWRLRLAGWRVRAVPSARVVHLHAATSDRRSDLFHFHNERNRLLTLIRCAPLPVAPLQFGRFLLTTASLAATRTMRPRRVLDAPNFRLGLRLRVAGAVLAAAPGQYARRPRRRLRGRSGPVRVDGLPVA